MTAELPVEEGWVYGQAPKQPRPPPDIHGMFEAIGVPKGKLGELPHPKEWYDGAKDRAAARGQEMEQLYVGKDALRQEWCWLVLAELDDWGGRVDQKLKEKGAVGGLAELLARTAHERPSDEARIDALNGKTEEARRNMAGLTKELRDTRDHLRENERFIREKEEADVTAEIKRVEEKKAADERKKKAEKILAKQAALLRGEEWPESEEEDEEGSAAAPDESPAMERTRSGGSRPGSSPSQGYPPTFLAPAGTALAPVPELRGGLARQLPPLETSPSKATLRPDSGHSRR